MPIRGAPSKGGIVLKTNSLVKDDRLLQNTTYQGHCSNRLESSEASDEDESKGDLHAGVLCSVKIVSMGLSMTRDQP